LEINQCFWILEGKALDGPLCRTCLEESSDLSQGRLRDFGGDDDDNDDDNTCFLLNPREA